MKKAISIAAIALLTAGLFVACSSTISTTGSSLVTVSVGQNQVASIDIKPATMQAKLNLFLAQALRAFGTPDAMAYIPSIVQRVRLSVSAAEMVPMVATQDVGGLQTVSFVVEVPNGPARLFVVDAYDSSNTRIYSGNASADLKGVPVTLTINMTYVVPKILVANSVDNTVSVIDSATNTVIATLLTGTSPAGVVANPATNKAYVANRLGDTVSVIDLATNAVVDTIAVLVASPAGLGIDTSINKIFVSNDYSSASVDYIDAASGNALGTIAFGAAYGLGVAANPVTHKAYATDWGEVYVIDTVTSTPTGSSVPVGGTTISWFGVAVNSVTNRVYVTDTTSFGQVFVIDGNTDTQINTIAVGTNPEGVAIDPSADRAYVANSGDGTVSVIDTTTDTVVATITVGTTPMAVAVFPSAKRAYVTNNVDGTVSVIDTTTNTVTTTIMVGNGPLGIAVSR